MARKKFIPFIAQGVSITDIAHDGRGIGKHEDKVLFVKGAVPGDLLDVSVRYKKGQLFEGSIASMHQPSAHRVVAFCSHFGVCGGCKWQNMAYSAQLIYKQKQVKDSLERIAGLANPVIQNILPAPKTQHYRNKLEYTFSSRRFLDSLDESNPARLQDQNALGFHVPLRFDKIVNVQTCYLQPDPSNAIRLAVGAYARAAGLAFYDLKAHTGLLRNLIIRTSTTGDIMVIVVFARQEKKDIAKLLAFLASEFPEITSLQYVINTKKNDTLFDQDIITYQGSSSFITEEMEGLKFRLSAKSFYQTNSEQALQLYKVIRECAGLSGKEVVYDLYTGIGSIANFIARNARKVIGIEYVPDAIVDAKANAVLNNLNNTDFYAGDIKDVLDAEFLLVHGKPDVIITDPPRSGMHATVVQTLLDIAPSKIVYVSCNPATQGRDLALLQAKYQITQIQPVDMFPHTAHVENVVLLSLIEP